MLGGPRGMHSGGVISARGRLKGIDRRREQRRRDIREIWGVFEIVWWRRGQRRGQQRRRLG